MIKNIIILIILILNYTNYYNFITYIEYKTLLYKYKTVLIKEIQLALQR
jgi:hypothetical protein